MAERKGIQVDLGRWATTACFFPDPLNHLSPQTGQMLEKGPVLHFDHLKRELGGGYRCVASVPSVPGLNRTQLVNVAIFGETLWAETRSPKSCGFELFDARKLLLPWELWWASGRQAC